jgi:signal transduction histidine kinase
MKEHNMSEITFENMSYVLLVDDSYENLKILERTLNKEGFTTKTAKNGQEALDLIYEEKPDTVLLDIMMPEKDGYETLAEIRANDRYFDLPVIFLTAKTESSDIIKGFQLGVNDYITKPFNYAEVIARVKVQVQLKLMNDKNEAQIVALETLNNELQNAKTELLNSNRRKDKFFSIVAQELRNPFQGLLGLSDLLVSSFGKFSVEELLDISYNLNYSAKYLYTMLENLIIWSRLQAGAHDFQPLTENLSDTINYVIDDFKDATNKKNIAVDKNIPDVLMLKYDSNLTAAAISNIFSNAVKYSHINSSITVTLTEDSDYVLLEIADKGTGIQEKEINDIFELKLGTSKKGTEDEPGTGLGLIIASEAIRKHNGQIDIQSELGVGTKVKVIFPNMK